MSATNNATKIVSYIAKKQQAGEIVSVRQASQYLRSSAAVAAEALDEAEAVGLCEYTIFEIDSNRYYFLNNAQDVAQATLLLPTVPAEKQDIEMMAAMFVNAVTFPDAFSPTDAPAGYAHLMNVYPTYFNAFGASALSKDSANTHIAKIWENTLKNFDNAYRLGTVNAEKEAEVPQVDLKTAEPAEDLPMADDTLPDAGEIMDAKVTNQPKFVPEGEAPEGQLSFASLPEAGMDLVAAINTIKPVELIKDSVCPLCNKALSAGTSVARGMGLNCLRSLASFTGYSVENLMNGEVVDDDSLADMIAEYKSIERRQSYPNMDAALLDFPEGLVSWKEMCDKAVAAGIPANRVKNAAGGNKGLGTVLNPNWKIVLVGGKNRYFSVNASLNDLRKETAEAK